MLEAPAPVTQFDSKTFRNAVGRFATGVTIITARTPSGEPVGLTANSFTSVSLEPALVLFCLARSAESFGCFGPDSAFAVNVLSADQEALSNRFAKSGTDKYAETSFSTWDTDTPILGGCLANLECTTERVLDGGDHVIVLGRVTALQTSDSDAPLLFFGGRYAGLSAP